MRAAVKVELPYWIRDEARRCARCGEARVRCIDAWSWRGRHTYGHRCAQCGHAFKTESLLVSIGSMLSAGLIAGLGAMFLLRTTATGAGVPTKIAVVGALFALAIGVLVRTVLRLRAARANPVVP